MESAVELHDLFSYSLTPIIVFSILLLFLCAILVLKRIAKKLANRPKPIPKEVPKPININNVKATYLNELYKLEIGVNNGSIATRDAYIKSSRLIRDFVFEITGIKMQNLTLSEIDKEKFLWLHELISEYYRPEFDYDEPGNIKESIIKTREAIEKWN